MIAMALHLARSFIIAFKKFTKRCGLQNEREEKFPVAVGCWVRLQVMSLKFSYYFPKKRTYKEYQLLIKTN